MLSRSSDENVAIQSQSGACAAHLACASRRSCVALSGGCAIARVATVSTTATTNERTGPTVHGLRCDTPRDARVLAEVADHRHVDKTRGLQSRLHRIGLIETVLDDERATRGEMRARVGADPIVEREAI